MEGKWPRKKIWDWYNARPWITGCNFIPSTIHSDIELWQEADHEEVMKQVRKEVELAAGIGFNSFRMLLPYEVWKYQHDSFMRNFDGFLDMIAAHDITLMPILFNDCLMPKEMYKKPEFGGKFPEPVPGYFGGVPDSPFDGLNVVGYFPGDEKENWPEIETYVKEMGKRYGNDERVIIWNVWNEIGNSNRNMMSAPLMEKCFEWLRETGVSQPLTADVWGVGSENPYGIINDPKINHPVEELSIGLSDIISFHCYGDYLHLMQYIDALKKYELPIVNTEWLHRPFRSLIQTHLPVFHEEKIGSYIFGFVNGKAQFNYVWNFIKKLPDIDIRLWMHDIFYWDFTPYDPKEIETFQKYNRAAK